MRGGLGGYWRVSACSSTDDIRVCAQAPGKVAVHFYRGRWVTSGRFFTDTQWLFNKRTLVQAGAVRTAPSFGAISRPLRLTQTWVNSTPSRKMSAE